MRIIDDKTVLLIYHKFGIQALAIRWKVNIFRSLRSVPGINLAPVDRKNMRTLKTKLRMDSSKSSHRN